MVLKVGSNGAIVCCGALKYFERKLAAKLKRSGFVAHRSEHTVVICCIDHDGYGSVVLRRRTEHRGTTDVDVLNGQLKGDVGFGHSCLKWVEVHHHEINHLDLVLGSGTHVILFVAAREKTAMDLWVEGLDAAFHHFREARIVTHFSHRDALFFK